MSRRVVPDDGTSVSLLPFLAVLICTMGALIILLVVVVQQARVSAQMASFPTDVTPVDSGPPDGAVAAQVPPVATNPPAASTTSGRVRRELERTDQPVDEPPSVDPQMIEELQRTREKLLWEIEKLQESRDKTGARVEDRRLELSQVESHARTLQGQLDSLQADAARLEQAAVSQADISAAQTQRLRERREELATVKLELDKARLRNQQQIRSFAVVPYTGPHGTVRQPFYIECLGDSVLLQPEGIRLDISDLSPPLGPANPLAAALRQKREWLVTQRGGQLDSEPYPLLIVRPDGSSTYQRARVALQSWGTEFGYELIEADRPLVYPSVAPAVIPGMQEAIAQARQRQALQRRIAQSVERQRSKQNVLLASPRGGFVHYDGRPITVQDFVDGANAGGESSSGSSDLAGTPDSTHQAPPSTTSSSVVTRGLPTGEMLKPRDLPADLKPLAARDQPKQLASRKSQFALGNPTLTHDNSAIGVEEGVSRQRDAAFERVPRQSGGETPATLADLPPTPLRDGANVERAVASTRGNPSAAGGSATDGSSTGGPGTGKGGLDWSLPNATPGAIGITRPIDGNCELQRIVIMPEAGSSDRPVEIRFDGATANAIEPFAGAIRRQIESWGIAGSGVYWKPVLRLSVAPNAARRFMELQSQLRDSGIEVLRR